MKQEHVDLKNTFPLGKSGVVPFLPGKHHLDVATQQQEHPKRGMFHLSVNNRRRQMGGYRECECEGTLYSDGFVHLNTQAIPIREFHTFTEMLDTLTEYGGCTITWLSEVK